MVHRRTWPVVAVMLVVGIAVWAVLRFVPDPVEEKSLENTLEIETLDKRVDGLEARRPVAKPQAAPAKPRHWWQFLKRDRQWDIPVCPRDYTLVC